MLSANKFIHDCLVVAIGHGVVHGVAAPLLQQLRVLWAESVTSQVST